MHKDSNTIVKILFSIKMVNLNFLLEIKFLEIKRNYEKVITSTK